MEDIITAEFFFNEAKKEIIADKNIENYNLVKETIENKNLNDYFKDCSDTKIIIPILQKVNEYFLKNCEIHIDNLTIYPIETEIYFVNDWFHDGMCHMNELQKDKVKGKNGEDIIRFGKLYFHRIKKDDKRINWQQGGVDVCISNGDYYLSILIRSALVKDKMISGIKRFREEIIPDIIEIKKDKIKKNEIKEKEIKEKIENKEKEEVLFKRENKIDTNNIHFQQRIFGDKYAKCSKEFKLNCLNLGEYKNKYKYKYEYLQSIIDTKQAFYKDSKNKDGVNNIDEIISSFEKQKKLMA